MSLPSPLPKGQRRPLGRQKPTFTWQYQSCWKMCRQFLWDTAPSLLSQDIILQFPSFLFHEQHCISAMTAMHSAARVHPLLLGFGILYSWISNFWKSFTEFRHPGLSSPSPSTTKLVFTESVWLSGFPRCFLMHISSGSYGNHALFWMPLCQSFSHLSFTSWPTNQHGQCFLLICHRFPRLHPSYEWAGRSSFDSYGHSHMECWHMPACCV